MVEKDIKKKPLFKMLWLITLIIIIAVGLIACSGDDDSNNSFNNDNEQDEVDYVVEDDSTQDETETEEEEEDNITKYKSGTYKIGTDIPAGEYKLFADGGFAYYEVDKDSNGTLESILSNDNFTTFTYITVSDGQYLELKNCHAFPSNEAPVSETVDGKYDEGTYKVGFDIPAGEYKVTSYGGFAYVEVAKDSLGTLDSIITNDNFENDNYITVSDGQYLKINDAYIQN